jgi:hypothetical protein
VLSVLLYIVSSLLLYCAMMLAFASDSLAASKWWIFGLFAGLGALPLLGGLALKRFRTWRRDVGIVLLSASGIATMVALGIASLFIDDEMRKILSKHIDSIAMFSDYISGGSVIAGGALLGWLLLRSTATTPDADNTQQPEQHATTAP